MKKINTLIALALTMLASTSSFAATLNCRETNSFRGASLTINRDGHIGFNGTYVDIKAPWFSSTTFGSISKLTGRAEDNFAPQRVILNISPKAACTMNGDSLTENFSCKAKNVKVGLTGSLSETVNDGSSVQLVTTTKDFLVLSDVDLKVGIKEIYAYSYRLSLVAEITNPKTGEKATISERMSCEITN